MNLQSIIENNRASSLKIDIASEIAQILKTMMDMVEDGVIESYTFNDRMFSPNEGSKPFIRQFHFNLNIIKLSVGQVFTDMNRFMQSLDKMKIPQNYKNQILDIHDKIVLINSAFNHLVPVPNTTVFSHSYFFSKELNAGTGYWSDKKEQAKWKILPEFVQELVEFPKPR